MSVELAAILTSMLTFVFFVAAARWHIVPWLSKQRLDTSLTVLLWFHVMRIVALQLFSAQSSGLPISDGARNTIVYGDVIAAIMAFIAIAMIGYRSKGATAAVWVFSSCIPRPNTTRPVLGDKPGYGLGIQLE